MAMPRDVDIEKVARMKAEARDPDLALLRWAAARGLLLSSLFGLSSLSDAERDRLFERLLDDSKWTAIEQGAAKPSRTTAVRAASPKPSGARRKTRLRTQARLNPRNPPTPRSSHFWSRFLKIATLQTNWSVL